MSLREQSIVGCFPEFVFQLFVVHVLVGFRKQFINNLFFQLRSVLLVLIIIMTIIYHTHICNMNAENLIRLLTTKF